MKRLGSQHGSHAMLVAYAYQTDLMPDAYAQHRANFIW